MAFLPLIERELRVALRKQRPVRTRLRVACACAGGSLLFLLLAAATGSRSAGRDLHKLLCLAAAYMVLRTPIMVAGALAEERGNQTLGLLFLSGLSAGEIFISKLFSAAMIAFTGAFAMFPLLALPFLLGGVSFELFLATIFVLPNLLLFVLAVTLLASALTEDDGSAMVLAAVLVGLLAILPALIAWGQTQFRPGTSTSSWWLWLSPASGPYLLWQGLTSATVRDFWNNFLVTACWTAVSLLAAGLSLRRLWRKWQENSESTGWGGRWQHFVHGHAEDRLQLARRWLPANPYVWLATRDARPVRLAWSVLGGLSVLWLVCFSVWRSAWLSVPNFFITATLLNLALHWMIRYTAAAGLGAARRDGSYELILTTALKPRDIVWGQLEALRWQFTSITQGVLAVNCLLMFAGLASRRWTPAALFVYCSFWACLLAWSLSQSRNWRGTLLVMWAALNCGRPAHALWRAAGLNSWWWLWIVFNMRIWFTGFSRFPRGSIAEIALATALDAFLIVAGLIKLSRFDKASTLSKEREHRLVSEFREIVREPLPDPDDGRFKKWDFRERFPWGWSMVQQQLHERIARRHAAG